MYIFPNGVQTPSYGDLESLVAWMRASGVRRWRWHEFEIELEPPAGPERARRLNESVFRK